MDYSKTILVGRLTRDPEMRYTDEGTAVAHFTVATSEGYGENEKTHYVRVTVWGKLAENCAEHLVKGQEVLVEGGAPTASAWTDREGNPRATVEVTARTVQFGRKPNGK